MKVTKVILTDLENESLLIKEKYNLGEPTKEGIINSLNIYEGDKVNEDNESENIVLVLFKNESIKDGLEYIFENYNTNSIYLLSTSKIKNNHDLNIGDIVIPNTFITDNEENKAYFIESYIGENYDFTKFGLSLNGLCVSASDEVENHDADISDKYSYSFLQEVEKKSLIDNSTVILSVSDGINNENVVPILDFLI